MQLVDLDPCDQDVINVFADIDRLISSLYPVATSQALTVNELGLPGVYAVGLKNQDGIVACGAIVKQFDGSWYGEIRRLYVKPSYRGKRLIAAYYANFIALCRRRRNPNHKTRNRTKANTINPSL